MSPQLIEARALTKRYGHVTALDSADLVIGRGVTGLLGPNGAGKTTLLGAILGLVRPDAGSIEVGGLDPMRQGAAVRARIGYSPEHHLLPTDMPAVDLVRHIAEVHGIPRRVATARSSDALWYVGMGEERLRPLGTLSTGQRQRVKLAMALAHDPALILLDEPTDGLDPHQRDVMLDLIRRVGHDTGIDILMSSHLLDEVERTCDRVLMLIDGRVGAEGSIAELRGQDRGMLIEIDGDTTDLASRLSGRGAVVRVEGRHLRVELPVGTTAGADELALAVRDDLAATGAVCRRLSPGTVSLAQVYADTAAGAALVPGEPR